MDSAILHNAVAAVAPIVAIRIVDRNDRGTWAIDFKPEATAQQQADAQAALLAWVDPEPAALVREQTFIDDTDRGDFVGRLSSHTPAQIESYINNQIVFTTYNLTGSNLTQLRAEVQAALNTIASEAQTFQRAMAKKIAKALVLNIRR